MATDKETELKFRTAVIELENVIAETEKFDVIAWEHVARERGVFTENWEEKLRNHNENELMNWILKKSPGSASETKQQLLDSKETYYNKAIQQISYKDLLPGIVPLLKDLKKNGVKIVAASAQQNASNMVEKLEIGDFLDEVIEEADIGNDLSLFEKFLPTAEDPRALLKKCIAIINVKFKRLHGKTRLFVVGVGGEERVEGTDWVVKHTGELTYEALKEQFSKRQ